MNAPQRVRRPLGPTCQHSTHLSRRALRDRLLDATMIALRDESKEGLFIDDTVSVNITVRYPNSRRSEAFGSLVHVRRGDAAPRSLSGRRVSSDVILGMASGRRVSWLRP